MAVTPTYSPYDISAQITQFKQAYYGEDVRDGIVDLANKLNNELNNMATHEFVVVDDTLSVQGAGADAKATGDALATKADKDYAVIEDRAAIGPDSLAAIFSTASGIGVVTGSANGQLAIGQFNVEDSDSEYLFIAGNGNNDNDRHNAAVIDTTGNAWFAGSAYVGGADLAHGSELAPKSWVSSQGYASASALNDKVNTSDVSNSISTDASSTTKVPSVNAIKYYVDNADQSKVNTSDVSNDIVTDASSTSKVPCVKAIKDYVDGAIPPMTNYYTKSETDAAIAAAIGTAIGGSY